MMTHHLPLVNLDFLSVVNLLEDAHFFFFFFFFFFFSLNVLMQTRRMQGNNQIATKC